MEKVLFTVMILALFAGCNGTVEKDASAIANKKKKTEKDELHQLKIGGLYLNVEIADTEPTRTQGLMFRKSLPEDSGMLFIYPDEDYRSFWMKDTYVPLSLAYIDSVGVIAQVIDMEPKTIEPHPSDRPVRYVLEVNQGWFRRNAVGEGDKVENLPGSE